MRRLIVTADDFGLAESVNEAVEIAARDGVLTAASLMVGAAAARDAVARARRLPQLRVGLHLVLVNGQPLLPPSSLPALVGADGWFLSDLGQAGIRCFFLPGARRQIEAEVRAQFQAFAATGLPLDHVNAHCHFHLHPTVLGVILKVGREFGLRAVRLPREPRLTGFGALALSPWLALLRARLRRAGVLCNDYVLGLGETGAMTEATVLRLLENTGAVGWDDVGEMYFHPATRRTPDLIRAMPGYDHEGELRALTSPKVRAALDRLGLRRVAFSDLG